MVLTDKEAFEALFWEHYEWIQNGTYPEWPYLVYDFIESRGIKNVTEIGVATGAVSFAIALTRPETYYMIDSEAENHKLVDVVLRLGKTLGVVPTGSFVGDSKDEIKRISSFQLLIHDGEHSEESVSHDLDWAFNHGAEYAIVHDGNWPEVVRGVEKVCRPWQYMADSFGHPILVMA